MQCSLSLFSPQSISDHLLLYWYPFTEKYAAFQVIRIESCRALPYHLRSDPIDLDWVPVIPSPHPIPPCPVAHPPPHSLHRLRTYCLYVFHTTIAAILTMHYLILKYKSPLNMLFLVRTSIKVISNTPLSAVMCSMSCTPCRPSVPYHRDRGQR
jgi:hypothetical protein